MTLNEKELLESNGMDTTDVVVINLGNVKQVTKSNELLGYILEDGSFKIS